MKTITVSISDKNHCELIELCRSVDQHIDPEFLCHIVVTDVIETFSHVKPDASSSQLVVNMIRNSFKRVIHCLRKHFRETKGVNYSKEQIVKYYANQGN